MSSGCKTHKDLPERSPLPQDTETSAAEWKDASEGLSSMDQVGDEGADDQ